MSDGEPVLHGRMSGMSCRCILAILDRETVSTLVGAVKGACLGCLEGVVAEGSGFGSFVGV